MVPFPEPEVSSLYLCCRPTRWWWWWWWWWWRWYSNYPINKHTLLI